MVFSLIPLGASAITIQNSQKFLVLGNCDLWVFVNTSGNQIQVGAINLSAGSYATALYLQDISGTERDLTPSTYERDNWSTANIELACGFASGSVTNVQSNYVAGQTRSGYNSFYASFSYNGSTYTMSVTATGQAAIATTVNSSANSAPTANAGPDQTSVASAATVTLDGSGSSDPDAGDTLTYAWTQTSGTTMSLSSATTAQPTFTAPTLNIGDAAATLVFSLTVNDRTDNSTADTVSITVNAPSATTANAPTALVATASDGQVSIAFTAPSNDGGAAITDYEYQLDSGTWTSAGTAATPVVITGLTNGTAYSIKLRAVNSAGNGTESAAVSVLLGSPASEFEANKDVISSVVTDEALRGIRAIVSSNVRMTRAARERFVLGRQQAGTDSPVISFAATPLTITGSAVMRDGILNTQGMFFGQTGSNEGGQTRLFFGDFDVQRDADGSVSAQLNARLAWEGRVSTTAMYGYYLGAELGRATLEGTFAGEQDSFGASVGAYFVTEIQPNLYLDGFASLGLGRNRLELDNGILNVASDYTTTTGTVGASLTGVVEGDGYEFWPQLLLTYGKTHIGMMTFTGAAYSLVNNTLSLDAGSVSMASGTFTAEFKVPLDGRVVSDSHALFTFAPRVICERTMAVDTTNDCGGGAEIGIVSRSRDGLSNLSVNIRRDRVGNTTSTGLGLNFERVF
jgi:hypothetical protein